MGYYTNYNLIVKHMNGTQEYQDLVQMLKAKGILGYALDEYYDSAYDCEFSSADTVKWYEYNEDMTDISIHFPDMVFCLEGWGEDSTDIWRAYYKNGKAEYCPAQIIFPEPEKIEW